MNFIPKLSAGNLYQRHAQKPCYRASKRENKKPFQKIRPKKEELGVFKSEINAHKSNPLPIKRFQTPLDSWSTN
jgi:hypothetical protein